MDFPTFLSNLNSVAESPPDDLKDEERLACIEACKQLQEALESPLEAFIRFIFGAHQGIALRLGVDMKLMETAVRANGPVTMEHLAARSSADPELVRRTMRLLAGMKIFQEIEKDTYIARPLATAFAPPSPLAAGILHMSMHLSALTSLPEYFKEKGYTNPTDAFNGPWQYANRTNEHYFESLAKQPEQQKAFNVVMGISRMARGEEWFEFYPVEKRLNVHYPSDILLVDIGGGTGHDLVSFNGKFANIQGRLIIEDLPLVIADAKDLPSRIETAFYLRTVLHDWPDMQARIVLQHIRALISKDSILLINENSIPETNVPLYSAELDFVMMSCFSSLDRTEKQFRTLLDLAGFELLKVWRPTEVLPGSAVLFGAALK